MSPLYAIVYSDGVTGARMPWHDTLRLLRHRLHGDDTYRRRGIVPVSVVRA